MYILELKNKENHSVQTDFITSSFNQREVLHQGLKQADDSIRLQVPFSAEIWNFVNANKTIKAKITKDGETYFTGYVRPDFDFSKIQRFQPIQLELVNATYITSFYEIESSIAFKDTTLGVIVSNLLERAEITGQDTSFLNEPIIFDIIEEGTTVKDALSQILFEYGYFWDFDKNGEFTVQKVYNENVTPSVVLDGTNILEKVQVSKKEQEFDRVEVEYEHYEKFENILLFQDNTGNKGGGKGCFIELGPGKHLGQIEGETSYDITYDSDKGKVIWVDNASLSILSNNEDKIQSTFINKNTKGNLSVYNSDQYKSSYILMLEVWGTAYINTIESATIKVGQEGKNKSIKSKYIHSKEAAKNFAKMYYDWGKSCDYVISLQSKLNLDVGTIVEVNTAGKIIGRVLEKTTKLDGKPYTYKIEAIKEYELPEITSSILRKSSPIGTAARGTGILKIDTAPTAYTTPVSGITPAFRISKDVVKSQSLVDEVYTGDILQYSYYQYQVILVADDYVYTAARTSIRGSVGAAGATGAKGDTGATGAKGDKGDKGDKGAKGDKGDTGPAGPKGDKGENGTSVKILGTKPSASDLPAKGEIGDAWLVNGNLYVWADNSWENVGNIQGPKGDKGDTGPRGANGGTGPQGPIGPIGKTGDTGAAGKNATQYYIHYVYCDDTDLGTNYSTTNTRKYVGVYIDTVSADATSFAKVPSDVIWSQIEGDKGDTGAKGDKGDKGDKGATGQRGSLEFSGTEIHSFSSLTEAAYTITTASTGITSSTMPILVGDTYINTTTQDVWICSTAGTPTTAKWKYQGRRCRDKDDSNRFRMFSPTTDYGTGAGTKVTKSIVKGVNPFGKIDDLLKITNNGTVTYVARYVPYYVETKIDPKKTYRHVTYIKQEDTNCSEFIGIAGWEQENSFCLSLSGETINAAYFTNSNNFGTLGRWYMVVGYIVANGTTTAPADSGVYDMVTKQKVKTVTNYQWKPNVTYCTNSGCLIRYTASATNKAGTAYLYDVRLDEVNGTEPTLNELLNLDTTTKSKGTWKASTVYNIGDIVYLNGNSYICTANHTSGTSFDNTKWSIIASKGDKGDTGATGQRGGRDLAITTTPASYTTAIGGFTPSYRIALSTVKTQSGISTVYVGDTLVYGIYRYPVGYVDASYVYTAARTSVKGDTGTKTFYSDLQRTWTNEEWNRYSTVGYTYTWNNSTKDGMRIGDTFVITATLSEKGNSKGQIFTQITSISTSKNSNGYYVISTKTVASLIGEKGASSRTIAYRINYYTFTDTDEGGEIYVCGYNSAGDQADIPGYVIVNGAIHFIKGMFNPNVPINGYVVAEKGGTSDSPKTPFFAFYDWGKEKYYKIENGQGPAGKTWKQLFTEITNTSNYIVLGKVSSSNVEGPLSFEETTPCLLSSTIEDEENFVYQGVVATTTDMHTSITPYKFTQDEYGNWIKTALNTKIVKKWSFVLCMNATTPNYSTAAPVIKVFNGTWWYEIRTDSAYYSSLQSMMAGDLPAVAGYYNTLGLSVPSICGTYIKTLTSNKAFINELFANDITVGNKISTPFTPTTSLRCYVEYATPGIQDRWTSNLSAVYNSSGTGTGTSRYVIRFGHQLGSYTRIPVEESFICYENVTSVSFAYSTVDDPYTIPSSWTTISKTTFPNRENINAIYKWIFIKETFKSEASPIIYALPCYTTSTRSNGFEIKSDGSAIFTGKTRFEGGIGIVCDAKDIVRNGGVPTYTYHFPLDFKIYDIFLFLESNISQGSTTLLYKFTCVQQENYGKPAMDIFTTYDNTAGFADLIEAKVQADNVGYNSNQLPNGYINETHSWLKKIVVKQKNSALPIAAIRTVLIPYME